MMRPALLLCFLAVLGTAAALSFPSAKTKPCVTPNLATSAKRWAGSAALAASVVTTTPLLTQALDTTPTAVSVNVDAKKAFDTVKNHRTELKAAYKTFLESGAGEAVSVTPPSDLKAAARDALSGRGQVLLNGSPVGIQVESEKGALTLRIASDLFPRVPFLAPPSSSENIVPVVDGDNDNIAVVVAQEKAMDNTVHFALGDSEYDLTYEQIAEGSLLAVGGVYASSFAYYTSLKQNDEKEAATRKEKAAAAKKEKKVTPSKKETTPAVVAASSSPIVTETPEDKTETDDEPAAKGRRQKRWLGLRRAD